MKSLPKPSDRNIRIFNEAREAGFSQGVFTRLAEQEDLTRERIRAIVKQVSKFNQQEGGATEPQKPDLEVSMPTWKTTQEQADQFRKLCDERGWSLAFGVRAAVTHYLTSLIPIP